MMPPDGDQKPLVEQVEEERADEDRETFITESGLVEEVEEEDAKVGVLLRVLLLHGSKVRSPGSAGSSKQWQQQSWCDL
jgi:hypothetical protein